ncbi:hypothetical protein Hanom_Chr10g00952321 [Helianthus anomalus]
MGTTKCQERERQHKRITTTSGFVVCAMVVVVVQILRLDGMGRPQPRRRHFPIIPPRRPPSRPVLFVISSPFATDQTGGPPFFLLGAGSFTPSRPTRLHPSPYPAA